LISLARPEPGGQPNVLYITPVQTRASALLDDGALARIDLDMAGFSARDARSDESQDRKVTAARMQIHALRRDTSIIEFLVKADSLVAGTGYGFPFERAQNVFGLNGKISAVQAFDALLKGQADFDTSVQQWRKAGGDIALTVEAVREGKKLALSGPAQADATGDLTGLLRDGEASFRLAHGELSPE
jgi:hypothetical protein